MRHAIDDPSITSLPALFFAQAAAQGARPFLWSKPANAPAFQPVQWDTVAAEVNRLARMLRRLGVARGDRVALISESRPEWPIADLAIMTAGGICVPAYTTNTAADHAFLLSNSGARHAIVSTARLAHEVLAGMAQVGTPFSLISMEPVSDHLSSTHVTIHAWNDRMREDAAPVDLSDLRRTDTACIIYTSGTGGTPKGVMLSHGAILKNCEGAANLLRPFGLQQERFLSFLPLSHSYEHTAGLYFPISIGAQIFYAEGLDKLSQNMAEAKPTLMTAVPRLYEVLHGKFVQGLKKAPALQQKLFARTLTLGRRAYEKRTPLRLHERLENALLTHLVRRKVRQRFGGHLKALVSGGAPLNYDVGVFFTALGITLLQGYGQTEAAPVISCNAPADNRIESVGRPLRDVEIRLAADGEILVRGDLLMTGYWNEPQLTAQTIVDGWLHTGDIGTIDEDGHLRITDRKKDIIVNAGGDNISPQRVEGFLCTEPDIAQAMVYGDKRPHLVALIVPNDGYAGDRRTIAAAVERVNQRLSPLERVRRFVLADEPFTIQNGQLTPTLKIRRKQITETYRAQLDALYGK